MRDQANLLRNLASTSKKSKGNNATSPGNNSPCQTIAIASGKGGVGKSSLTVNLGITFSQWKYRVLILDGDLGMANIEVMVDAWPKYTLEHVINGKKTIQEIMVKTVGGMKLISGGSGVASVANLDGQQEERLFYNMHTLEKDNDILLIDTGAGITSSIIRFLASAQQVILVTTPEPTAITDVYGTIKVLAQTKTRKKVHLVVNKTENIGDGKIVFERLSKVAKKNLPDIRLSYLGEIPKDTLASTAVKNCTPLTLNYPQSSVAHAVKRIAKGLLYDEDMSKAEVNLLGMKGFIDRLKKSYQSLHY